MSNSSLFFVLDMKVFAKRGLKIPLTLFPPTPCVVLFLFITGCLLLKAVFQQRIVNPKIGFHQRVSSIKGVFHQRCLPTEVSFIKGHLLSKFVLHQISSSFKFCLPSKVSFHQRSSSINGHLSQLSLKKCSSITIAWL